MDKLYRLTFIICLLFINSKLSYSQSDSLDIYDYSFDQLSKIKITTASKVSQNVEEVPSTILIITKEEIKERGYFILEDILADLPGFQFRNIQGLNTYTFQRGIPNQNNLILVLIDGIQINELNSGGFYGGGQYNLSNIERIEVIYGPASVAYGTNAVSGIINIITKETTEKEIDINALIGTFNTLSANVGYSKESKNKDFGIRISAMAKQTDKANLKGQSGDNNWTESLDNYENDYAVDFKFKVKKFILGTNYLQKKTSGATFVKSVGTIYKDYGTLWNIRFVNNYIKYNNQIFKNIELSSTLYNRNATVLDNSVLYIVDTAQIGYYRPNNLTGLENVVSYSKNKFLLTGGVIFEYEQLAESFSISVSDSPEQKPSTPTDPDMEKNFLTSIFIEPQLTLFNNLYVSSGVRFDQSSIYDQVFTPRGGLSYKLKDQIIRFSYSEAYRAPKPWDYYDGMGNNSLLPEKMNSFETALNLSFLENYKCNIIAYKNTLDGAITKQVLTNDYRWINEGEIETDGIEIYFQYVSKKIKTNFNYTYTDSYNNKGIRISEISSHTANANITYSFNNYLKLHVGANYIGERDNPKIVVSTNSKKIEPYLIFNSTFSLLNYKNLNLQFIVRNILNTEYYHTSNRDPDRYRQSQRTLILSFGYNFKK